MPIPGAGAPSGDPAGGRTRPRASAGRCTRPTEALAPLIPVVPARTLDPLAGAATTGGTTMRRGVAPASTTRALPVTATPLVVLRIPASCVLLESVLLVPRPG